METMSMTLVKHNSPSQVAGVRRLFVEGSKEALLVVINNKRRVLVEAVARSLRCTTSRPARTARSRYYSRKKTKQMSLVRLLDIRWGWLGDIDL
jgi:hypothetical protein